MSITMYSEMTQTNENRPNSCRVVFVNCMSRCFYAIPLAASKTPQTHSPVAWHLFIGLMRSNFVLSAKAHGVWECEEARVLEIAVELK